MDGLRLENQLCFPLYACSKEIIRKYKPILDKLDLTYTQYITMLVLWEHNNINVKTLGEVLFLDSGTLTPLLKKLEQKEYIQITHNKDDKRNLVISITEEGKKLKERAKVVPVEIGKCINLSQEESITLYKLLYKMLRK
jgi:DNA-binding MarR family transcriptional regulator